MARDDNLPEMQIYFNHPPLPEIQHTTACPARLNDDFWHATCNCRTGQLAPDTQPGDLSEATLARVRAGIRRYTTHLDQQQTNQEEPRA